VITSIALTHNIYMDNFTKLSFHKGPSTPNEGSTQMLSSNTCY
jgi:hypothetical protein